MSSSVRTVSVIAKHIVSVSWDTERSWGSTTYTKTTEFTRSPPVRLPRPAAGWAATQVTCAHCGAALTARVSSLTWVRAMWSCLAIVGAAAIVAAVLLEIDLFPSLCTGLFAAVTIGIVSVLVFLVARLVRIAGEVGVLLLPLVRRHRLNTFRGDPA